jgi:predicted nucleic acid-binding protein
VGWTDTYLATTARSLGARVVSFDRGFDAFDGLDRLILKT